MIDDDLPSDLQALFEAERGREAPAPAAKARVHHALAASIGVGLLPPSGSPLDGAGAAAGSGASGAAALKAVGGAAAGGAVAGGAAASGALGKGLAIALAVTMAGTTATGVYLAQDDDQAPTRELTVDNEVPAGFDPSLLGARPVPASKVAPDRPAPAELAPVAFEQAPAAAVEPTPAERAARLAAERGLLDEARGAVARGDGSAALIALEAHRASFPDGQLVEEREALTVLALAKLERNDEAQVKARRFLARWPQSLFATAVSQAVEAPR
ncbi:MAG: hypothetical protein HYS27_03435 [Deltaproteobacteria bacterium]|nr:hypothetical protein [Deltaproteobacteria bacterium]